MEPIAVAPSDAAPLTASMQTLATDQGASVVSELMTDANVVALASQAIPPTPAALLDISPQACGITNPVITLGNNAQILLLGAQSLEMIGAGATQRAQPPVPPSPPSKGASGPVGQALDATA